VTKISKRRPRQYRNKKRALPDHFGAIHRSAEEEHPVDAAVEQRLQHQAVRKQLIRLQNQILERLDDKQPFFDLEDLRNSMSGEREQAYFDLGYEHGIADQRARARRGIEKPMALAEEIRERLVHTRVPPRQAALGLLECLWVVILGAGDEFARKEGPAQKRKAERN